MLVSCWVFMRVFFFFYKGIIMFSQKKIICSSSLGLTVFWEFEDADSICSLLDRDVWCDDVMFGPPFTFTLVISLAPGKFWFARAPSFLDLTGSWDSSIYNPNFKKKKIQKKKYKRKKRATGQIYHRAAIFENSNCAVSILVKWPETVDQVCSRINIMGNSANTSHISPISFSFSGHMYVTGTRQPGEP